MKSLFGPPMILLALALLWAPASPALAESFQKAQQEIDQRLQRSLDELSEVRGRIAKQKIPLSKQIVGLESDVLTLRRERERLLEIRDSRTIDLSSLRVQIESQRSQEEFVNSRLNEFVRDFEGRIDISELPRYESLTAAAKLAGKNVNLDAEGRRQTQVAVVEAALQRVHDQLGGQIFPGEALSPDGVLTRGKFIALGPTVFFSSEDESLTGLVESQLNAADPVVIELPGSLGDRIAEIAETGRGALPFDATLGKALKKQKASKTLGQFISDGGAVGYVIVGLGLTTLGLILFKWNEIQRFQPGNPRSLDRVLEELARGSQAGAAKVAREADGIAGEMLLTGVEHASGGRDLLEEVLFERILRVRPTLERFLPFLAITAAAAPLLGLLGTVIGMIKTFQLITIFGTGDAKSLSSGISEALVTTALGLIVAIPTLIVHGGLSRLAKHKLGLLEQLSVAFVNGVTAIRENVIREKTGLAPLVFSKSLQSHGDE